MEVAAAMADAGYFPQPEAGFFCEFFREQDVVDSRRAGFRKEGAVFFAAGETWLDIVAVVERIGRKS